MISVQICSMWALGYADPSHALNDMSDPQNLIQSYTLGEVSDDGNGLKKQLSNFFTEKINQELEKGNVKPDNRNPFKKKGDTYPITF